MYMIDKQPGKKKKGKSIVRFGGVKVPFRVYERQELDVAV